LSGIYEFDDCFSVMPLKNPLYLKDLYVPDVVVRILMQIDEFSEHSSTEG